MTNGKGSRRRDAQISATEEAARWHATFGNKSRELDSTEGVSYLASEQNEASAARQSPGVSTTEAV